MGNPANIVKGPALLYIDGSDVGYTSGGVRLGVVKDLWSRPSMDGVGASEAVILDQKFLVSTHLAELTLTNLKRAWGMQTSDAVASDGTKFYFGGGSDITYHTLEVRGNAPGTNNARRVHLYRVFATQFGQLVEQRGKEVLAPVSFEALLDITKNPKAQLGYIYDET